MRSKKLHAHARGSSVSSMPLVNGNFYNCAEGRGVVDVEVDAAASAIAQRPSRIAGVRRDQSTSSAPSWGQFGSEFTTGDTTATDKTSILSGIPSVVRVQYGQLSPSRRAHFGRAFSVSGKIVMVAAVVYAFAYAHSIDQVPRRFVMARLKKDGTKDKRFKNGGCTSFMLKAGCLVILLIGVGLFILGRWVWESFEAWQAS